MMTKRKLMRKVVVGILCSHSFLAPSVNANTRPWTDPKWGFSRTQQSFSKSLVFDQHFDDHSYQPQPSLFQANELKVTRIEDAPASAATLQKALEVFSPYVRGTRKEPSRPSAPALAEKIATAAATRAPAAKTETVAPVAASSETKAVAAPVSMKLTAPVKTESSQPTRTTATPAYVHTAPVEESQYAKVHLVSDGSIADGEPKPIAGAKIHWVSKDSKIVSVTDAEGVAHAPYKSTVSLRFFVDAPDYLPAMGYAVGGLVTPVVMVPQWKLDAHILQPLGIVLDNQRTLVIGKVVDRKLRPVSSVTVEAGLEDPFRTFYSPGFLGRYDKDSTHTGPLGDFFLSGIGSGIQYLMPTQETKAGRLEWPATALDFSGAPEVVTVTLQEGRATTARPELVDVANENDEATDDDNAEAVENQFAGVTFAVQGQSTPPDPVSKSGKLKISKLFLRSGTDLVEIFSPAHKKVWLNGVVNSKNFPATVGLFSDSSLDNVFSEVQEEVDLSQGVILGHLQEDTYRRPARIAIFDSEGRRNKTAKIYYPDATNSIRVKRDEEGTALRDSKGVLIKQNLSTSPSIGNFAITNLGPGEWTVFVMDAPKKSRKQKTPNVTGVMAVRADYNTITQIQF